jgi:hypothetical protein
VREGEPHTATKTSNSKTPESFIVGVGASGALLAGAAIVFVTLVGLVSFNVWPTGNETAAGVNVELSTANPSGSSAGQATPVSAAAGQVASTSVGGAPAGGGAAAPNAGGGNGGQGGGNGGQPQGGLTNPPATTPPTTDTGGSGDSGTDTSTPGTASKSPAHPVHPSHPDSSHGNVGGGTNGKEDPNSGTGSDVVTGKGPIGRPPRPSSSTSSSTSSGTSGTTDFSNNGRGHGSSRHGH